MRHWERQASEELFRHRLFGLERHQLVSADDRREAMVLRAPDWVNVIPLLPNGEVIFVRQWRFGIGAATLEIPGGMVEDEDERSAAARELFEETGYRAGTWRRLGEVHPNPAFLTNRCGTWLATDLECVGNATGDGEEEIEVTSRPLGEVPDLIARGEITHALVVAAFALHEIARPAPGSPR